MLRSLAFCVMGLCIAPMAAVAQDGTSSSDTAPATRPVSEKGMSLQDVLRHVYVNDPGLLAARSSLHATHELYPQALASRRPTISAEASIYTSNIENSNFTQGTGATTKQASLDAEQPLYTSGRSDAQVDKANNLIKAAYATYLQAEQDLLYRTAYAYMTVIRDRELLSLSQENENILKEEEKAVTERFQGGELTRTDVEQTKARVAKAQADRLNAWRALETSYAAFEKVTGQQPAGTFYYPVPGFTFPPTLEAMVGLAEQHNQLMQEARFALAAAEDDIDVNFSELLPRISAFASYDKQYDPQPGVTSESETQIIGLRATIPLYQGGAQRSRVREAKSRVQQRHFSLNDTRQDVRADILAQWKAFQMANQELALRQAEVDATKKARDGLREEARLGERAIVDILDIDQDILGAQSAYIRARYDALVASFSLALSLGIFSPEAIGLGDMAYDPGHHYRSAGDKILSMDNN